MRVGHISVAESGTSCWESNGRCPLDALAGYPVGTDAYRAPGFVLGLLRNFVGALGFPPLLCAAGAANALRYTVEYDPGHFCEENLWQSHVHMCIFAPAGMVHPAHAGARPDLLRGQHRLRDRRQHVGGTRGPTLWAKKISKEREENGEGVRAKTKKAEAAKASCK